MDKPSQGCQRTRKLRILLADDQSVFRAGLKMLLSYETDLEVVGEASTGREAIRLAFEAMPDLVVMDISLRDMSGIEATREIVRQKPETKVLVLTAHETGHHLDEVFESGARGYALKRAAATDLPAALRQVADGKTYVDPLMSRFWSSKAKEGR